MPVKGSDILLILVAIIFPPAAAFFIAGCGCDLFLSIIFTLLGYIPGHLHAFYLIYQKIQAEEKYGHGHYQYISYGNYEPISARGPPPPYTYGATNNPQA